MSNLDGYTKANPGNQDWLTWVALVKKAYKSQGHSLTNAQALMVAKESYPGKGNVIGHSKTPDDVRVMSKENIPEPPKRRAPKQDKRSRSPEVYRRERDRSNDPKRRDRSPPRGRSKSKYYSSDSEDDSPRDRRRSSRKEEPRKRRSSSRWSEEDSSDDDRSYRSRSSKKSSRR